MKNFLISFTLVMSFLIHQANSQGKNSDEEWIQLFNGKDLEHWIPKIKGYETGENYDA